MVALAFDRLVLRLSRTGRNATPVPVVSAIASATASTALTATVAAALASTATVVSALPLPPATMGRTAAGSTRAALLGAVTSVVAGLAAVEARGTRRRRRGTRRRRRGGGGRDVLLQDVGTGAGIAGRNGTGVGDTSCRLPAVRTDPLAVLLRREGAQISKCQSELLHLGVLVGEGQVMDARKGSRVLLAEVRDLAGEELTAGILGGRRPASL